MTVANRSKLTLTIGIIGVAILTVGVAACIGYAIDNPLMYDWGKINHPMALGTSVCFVMIGVAFLIITKFRINGNN